MFITKVISNTYTTALSLFVPSAPPWDCLLSPPCSPPLCVTFIYSRLNLSLHISEEPFLRYALDVISIAILGNLIFVSCPCHHSWCNGASFLLMLWYIFTLCFHVWVYKVEVCYATVLDIFYFQIIVFQELKACVISELSVCQLRAFQWFWSGCYVAFQHVTVVGGASRGVLPLLVLPLVYTLFPCGWHYQS